MYLLLFIAILILFTDQTCNLFKHTFQRLRPCNDPEVNSIIRVVQVRKSFSFFSGHAANTMAVATFLYFVLRRRIKFLGFIFLWPLIFAYSRIYLGLHYPGDILCGYLWGILMATIMLRVYVYLRDRYFPTQKENVDNPTNDEPLT